MNSQEVAAGIANGLVEIVDAAASALRLRGEPDVSTAPTPDKWSPKQILGHLIDSASNNHQRFVRCQIDDSTAHPDYDQDRWVAAQEYQTASWPALVELWTLYNRHLAHVIARLPEHALNARLSIGGAEPVSGLFVAQDYVRHLEHHLHQIGISTGTTPHPSPSSSSGT